MTDPWLLTSSNPQPGQALLGLDPAGPWLQGQPATVAATAGAPAMPAMPSDAFGSGVLSPEFMDFVAGQSSHALADPMTMLQSLLGLPEQGRELEAVSGSQDPADRAQLEAAIKELFAELYAQGDALEARPGSKLAEAFATGDFSEITAEDIASLFETLKKYQEQDAAQVASHPQVPMAPQGSWNPGGGGNSHGGGTQTSGANAPAAAPSGPAPVGPPPPGTDAGQHLAQVAEATANGMGTTGWCYKGVSQAVGNALGVPLTGGSAYMAADQLAGMPDRFQEVEVSPENLTQLPPGAVVVWGKTNASPHGHISVALGDGREASDHVQNQITSLRGASNYRVFLPQG